MSSISVVVLRYSKRSPQGPQSSRQIHLSMLHYGSKHNGRNQRQFALSMLNQYETATSIYWLACHMYSCVIH